MNGNKLGFLTRGERVLNEAPTHDGAGPGALYQTQFNSGPENFAPFGCTAKRETKVPAQFHPPPGAYDSMDLNANKVDSNTNSNKHKALGILHSKTKRFVPAKPTIGPGPGTYVLKPAIQVAKAKKNGGMRKARSEPLFLAELRDSQPHAPSIPNKHQSFGYEEDTSGNLKPQVALNPGFTGRALDSVGPGDYDPKPLHRSKVISNFAKGTERIVGQRPSSNPGPGYYNHKSSFESLEGETQDDGNFYMKMAQAHKKSLSSFVSTTQRVPIEGKVDPREPGPMSYHIPRTGVQIKKKDVRIQCFDSTVTRFTDPTPKSQRTKTHPGSYKPMTSDFDKNRVQILRRKRMIARSGWAQNVSFQCTEERFFMPEPETQGPPPGHYSLRNGVGDVKKANDARSGPFGSSLKRFTHTGDHSPSYRTQEQEEAAFHAYTDEPTQKRSFEPPRKSPVKPSRVFVSNEQRFDATKDIQFTPNPGTYDVSYKWKHSKGGGVVPMSEHKSKSVIPLEVKMPGPGDYNIGKSLDHHDDPKRSTNRQSAMGGTERRFIPEKQTDAPPPGTYNATPGTLITPTHNVYLSAEF